MGRSIVITGASSGIGRAVAERFLAAGWKVALIARRADALAAVASGSDQALALPCDVIRPDRVDAAFAAATARFGRIDALFNNAGIFRPAGLIDEIPLSDWTETVDVNLNGMFHAARAAFRQMRAQSPQGGRIINNGSISAQVPRPGSVGYTVTKHAISGLTKALALDGRPYDIACGQIDIGNAETDMVRTASAAGVQAGRAPEPMMDVAHVADAVLAMADLPLSANVLSMTLMATKMALVGRG